jgi:hypothetical protein
MLSLGYYFGIYGTKNYLLITILSIIFAVVMFLILALDRPETGIASINQSPVITLKEQLDSWQNSENK